MMAVDESTLAKYLKVAVNDLKVGMYVISVGKTSDVDLKPGLITSQAVIRSLASMNISSVVIDLSKSKHTEQIQLDNPESNLAPVGYPEPALTELEKKESKAKAKKLYTEAKNLQVKLLQTLKTGEPIDIKPIEEMADDLIDSIFRNNDATIFLSKIREKDSYLMEHSLNVGMLLANFGRFLDLPREEIKQLLVGGLLHDTGKILIPDEILHKPGKFTPEEFDIMKKHVEYGVQFLDKAPGITSIMRIVAANHHERLDGLGYPRGLKAEQLCIYSRMSTIVDVYDALTADRCYKKGMPSSQAFRILMQGTDTQFDKSLVHKFIKCMGVYPIGSLLKLSSGKLALVVERQDKSPLRPIVKVIYSLTSMSHTDVKMVDLSKVTTEEIESVVDPKEYNIDIARFF